MTKYGSENSGLFAVGILEGLIVIL